MKNVIIIVLIFLPVSLYSQETGDSTKIYKNAMLFNFNGLEYIVCDPTYVNADAGMEMPQFKDVDPKVIQF